MEGENYTQDNNNHDLLARIERVYQKIRGLPPPIKKIERVDSAVARKVGLILEGDHFPSDFDQDEKY